MRGGGGVVEGWWRGGGGVVEGWGRGGGGVVEGWWRGGGGVVERGRGSYKLDFACGCLSSGLRSEGLLVVGTARPGALPLKGREASHLSGAEGLSLKKRVKRGKGEPYSPPCFENRGTPRCTPNGIILVLRTQINMGASHTQQHMLLALYSPKNRRADQRSADRAKAENMEPSLNDQL